MNLCLDLIPGDLCWVMKDNQPLQLTIDSISIVVALDYSKKNITIGAKYHLTRGAFGGDYQREDICKTRQELKEKIFGDKGRKNYDLYL